jgi:hypothetical protein
MDNNIRDHLNHRIDNIKVSLYSNSCLCTACERGTHCRETCSVQAWKSRCEGSLTFRRKGSFSLLSDRNTLFNIKVRDHSRDQQVLLGGLNMTDYVREFTGEGIP